jgi:hypothetical protein
LEFRLLHVAIQKCGASKINAGKSGISEVTVLEYTLPKRRARHNPSAPTYATKSGQGNIAGGQIQPVLLLFQKQEICPASAHLLDRF